ncbi:hypothetical protein HGRIS_011734 [Hohenbuehelia grisea]|uniref:Uncharacterized protein n=1 Tax=Hohenbuehelia grisea TaxID=104357 RepID=A0ABR3JXF9_9AGAR
MARFPLPFYTYRLLIHLSRIEPIIYRRVSIEYRWQAEAFLRTIESSSKPASFFANYVKAVCFAYGIKFPQATKILAACPNISSLACWIEPTQHSVETEDEDAPKTDYLNVVKLSRTVSAAHIRPRRLSVTLSHLLCTPDPDFTASLLSNVTHLDIYQGSQYFQDWSWTGFGELNSLTHVSFDLSVSSPLETVHHFLARCPKSVQLCLVQFTTRDSMIDSVEEFFSLEQSVQKMIAGDVDPRIVVGTTEPLKEGSRFAGSVVVRPYEEVVKDWSYTPDGQNDAWMEAEEIQSRWVKQ